MNDETVVEVNTEEAYYKVQVKIVADHLNKSLLTFCSIVKVSLISIPAHLRYILVCTVQDQRQRKRRNHKERQWQGSQLRCLPLKKMSWWNCTLIPTLTLAIKSALRDIFQV